MRTQIQSLALLSGLRICCYCELWCRRKMWLESPIAVAVASSYSSYWTPSLGTSMCCRCGPKKTKWINNWHMEIDSFIIYCFVIYMLLVLLFTFFFFFFFLFRAAPKAYRSSQARDQIIATTVSLHHSYLRSKPCLWPTPQLMAAPDPQPTDWGPGSKLMSSWILIRFISTVPQWELLVISVYQKTSSDYLQKLNLTLLPGLVESV